MCVPNSPLFQHCQVYDWPPFFKKKYMNGPFFLDSNVKGPIFLTSWYMHIFFAQRFFKAAYPLGITWTDCDICLTTSKKWVQKIKGQYMNRSAFWMIEYMNGSVFSKARYMNGVGFEILAHTPVPKLPHPPPPPPPPDQMLHSMASVLGITLKTPRKPASENVVCLWRLLNYSCKLLKHFLHYLQTV